MIGACIKLFDFVFTILTLGLTHKDFHCDWCEYCILTGIIRREKRLTNKTK